MTPVVSWTLLVLGAAAVGMAASAENEGLLFVGLLVMTFGILGVGGAFG